MFNSNPKEMHIFGHICLNLFFKQLYYSKEYKTLVKIALQTRIYEKEGDVGWGGPFSDKK